ncbi:MAG TPA: hypothetical protein VK194_10725 [Candidatus Deferrimicrobium sp.]|nr:hypothetical protein [Candidatus Deferrimicrobium sp.]
MTEGRATEQFETRFAGRIRAYTDPATERRVDALAIARSAMSSQRATGWSQHRLGAGLLGRGIAGVGWAGAVAAIALIGLVGVAVLGRPSDSAIGPLPTPPTTSTSSPAASAGGPVPDVLRHSWQRPLPVMPGLDRWATGFLSMDLGRMDFGPEPGAAASRTAIAAAGLDTLVATATVETRGCATGDIGAYRWSVEGSGTVLTLTPISADACPAREEVLAGQWVRSDLPLPEGEGTPLPPGTYRTSAFDPFDDPGVSGQLSYTVPDGWKVKEDKGATFVLHHLPDAAAGQSSTDAFVALFAHPRLAADYAEGATCGPVAAAPGVGGGLDDLAAAIVARPGVTSSAPAAVTIGGTVGRSLDLQLATSWTGGCLAPGGRIVALPILVEAGSAPGPVVGLEPDQSVRLVLLDLTGGRIVAVVVYGNDTSRPTGLDALVAEAMPVVESFGFHPPLP